MQKLVSCFRSGSDSFCGDACEVKVAAPSSSPSAEAEYWRIRAMAQQVTNSLAHKFVPKPKPHFPPQRDSSTLLSYASVTNLSERTQKPASGHRFCGLRTESLATDRLLMRDSC